MTIEPPSTFDETLEIILGQDKEAIERLLTSNIFDINQTDKYGRTLLHNAVLYSEVEKIKIILDQPKVDINAKSPITGETPFLTAARFGKFGALKYLLERGADAYAIDISGNTALMFAAGSYSIEFVEFLLELGLYDVNAVNFHGSNTLMNSVDDLKIFKRLFDISNTSQECTNGAGLLHCACRFGSIEVVELIVEMKIFDLNKKDNIGRAPIHYAIEDGSFDLVDLLIRKGANITDRSDEEFSAFQYIVMYDDSEAFLDYHAIPCQIWISAIVEAARWNRVKTLKRILERMEAREIENNQEMIETALNQAAYCGNLDCVKLLLESCYIRGPSYVKAIFEALSGNKQECARYIYENLPEGFNRAKDLILGMAIAFGCHETCRMLLQHGANPNTIIEMSYLMMACSNESLEIVKLLVEFGADINYKNEIGTALLLATEQGHLDMVKYLLENSADSTLSDDQGFSPVIYAKICCPKELFDAIYAKDQNIHYEPKGGNTLFLAACSRRNVKLVDVILRKGTNISAVNNNGDNCLHRAAKRVDSLKILIYLLENLGTLDGMLNAKNNDGKTPLDLIVGHKNSSYISQILNSNSNTDISKYFIGPNDFKIDNNNFDICLICRDDFLIGDEARRLPCKHIYHRNCLFEWSKSLENCPYCKSIIFTLKKEPIPTATVNNEASSAKVETSCCLIS